MNSEEIKLHSTKQFESWFIPEPTLIFGDGNTDIDPKRGLSLYGPLRTRNSDQVSPTSIRIGIIGDGNTVGATTQFINRLNNEIESNIKEPFQNPSFPGFKKYLIVIWFSQTYIMK